MMGDPMIDLYSPLLAFALVNLLLESLSLWAKCYKPGFLQVRIPEITTALALLAVTLALTSWVTVGEQPGQ